MNAHGTLSKKSKAVCVGTWDGGRFCPRSVRFGGRYRLCPCREGKRGKLGGTSKKGILRLAVPRNAMRILAVFAKKQSMWNGLLPNARRAVAKEHQGYGSASKDFQV